MITLLLLVGCGDPDPCASTRDLPASPAALTLTPGEHGAGWGRTDCFQCHQRFLIHQNDCSLVADVDGSAIEAETEDDCVACHGWNGVDAWVEVDTGAAP